MARTFDTFSLAEADQKDIAKVLQEFETRCTPVTNVIYKRYILNKRAQEPRESSDHYLTAIIKQADQCQYGGLKDELIIDRLVSEILNDQVREKLLSKTDLTLAKAIKLLKTSEATHFQAQDMAVPGVSTVQAINTHLQRKPEKGTRQLAGNPDSSQKPCHYCDRRRAFKKEACPAFNKQCLICRKKVILLGNVIHQKLTMLKMRTVMMRKLFSFTQLDLQPASSGNLHSQ